MKLRYLLPMFIFLGIVLLFWRGLGSDPHAIPSVLIGQPVPHYTLPTLEGDKTSDRILIGRVHILHVWTSWCDTCRHEFPFLLKIAREKDVPLIGINYKDTRDGAKKLLKQVGNPFQTTIFDPDGRLAIQLGVTGTPETFIVDARGIIRYKLVGPMTPAIWINQMRPLIQELQGKHA